MTLRCSQFYMVSKSGTKHPPALGCPFKNVNANHKLFFFILSRSFPLICVSMPALVAVGMQCSSFVEALLRVNSVT